MAVISKGQTFATGDQVTALKLNNLADNATFTSGAVDNVSTQLSGGAIIVKDGGVTTAKIADANVTAAKLATDALELAYPVGSIYMNATNSTNPSALLGFGTWVTFGAGRVPVGIDSTDDDFDAIGIGTNTNGTTGSKTHTLKINEIPAHNHSVTSTGGGAYANFGSQGLAALAGGTSPTFNTNSVGGGEAHNNLQPYIVVHMWKRTI